MGDMRYISLFSGIEAASVAWEPLGWKPVCFAELDPFPCAVLEHRYPDVPNVGDVTKVNWKKFKNSSAAVMVDPVICMADDNSKAAIDEGMCGSLKVGGSAPWIAQGRMVVRRLTPMECERLQGFTDDWTKVLYRGKPAEECPDGPRYKAIGNSFAVPVVRWIGERIAMADKEGE